MVGFPDDEEYEVTVKTIRKEKEAYIRFLENAAKANAGTKLAKIIEKDITKKKEELEAYIARNPIEEDKKTNEIICPVKICPTFLNSNATPEIWDPEVIRKNYYGVDNPESVAFQKDFGVGFIKVRPIRFTSLPYNSNANKCYICNIMSTTPGVDKSITELDLGSLYVESILYKAARVDNSYKYQIITLPEKGFRFYESNGPGYIKIMDQLVHLEDVPVWTRSFLDFDDKTKWNGKNVKSGIVSERLMGFIETDGETKGAVRLMTIKAESDYAVAPVIVGVKIAGDIIKIE